ncbi:MAG: uracil-DNA glycosylase [Planctomycetota bacterium]|jgi:DNA polymerase
MTGDGSKLQRLARQHVETGRLLGVDFVPIRSPAAVETPSAVEPPSPATGAEAATSPASEQFSLLASAGGSAPEMPHDEKPAALETLQRRHDAECPHCTEATTHTQTVFGEGDPDADLMFIGEAPGEEEDRTGRPFVGRAGKKLDDMIKAMGLERGDVYIANILKSRPPGNRTPLPTEVDRCSTFLAEQIRIIRPRVIVALGGPATKWLIQTTVGITRLRGQWSTYNDSGLSIPVMPTFHPAYLLRNYTLDTRTKVWSDMQAVMTTLGLVGAGDR